MECGLSYLCCTLLELLLGVQVVSNVQVILLSVQLLCVSPQGQEHVGQVSEDGEHVE